jgi:uncharacterized protein YciI
VTEPLPADSFDCFELILLRRPAGASPIGDEEAERLQALHLGHLAAMEAAGHLAVAGPFDEQDDASLRGLALYHVGSLERARELAESDPAVVAGRFEVEAMRFWCHKDHVVLPRSST